MKLWEYYSTPKKHPWVGSEEIEEFKTSHPNGWVAQFIWGKDRETREELRELEEEFIKDSCKDLGITRKVYYKIDPFDKIIGCPEEEYFPSSKEYEKMFLYLLDESRKKKYRK